jgi:hypothetical protein
MKKKSFLASAFLAGISQSLFAALAASSVALPEDSGLPKTDLVTVISNFSKWLLGIFGFLAIISFAVSGIMYFLAAGDDKRQEKAKKQMQWSIAGVVIGLAGLVVIYAVDAMLRGTSGF